MTAGEIIIAVRTVPHKNQRYDTVGDWQFDKVGNLTVTVSNMANPYYMTLMALHEIVEAILCRKAMVRDEDVTTFDQLFEHERGVGRHPPNAEPGDDPRAPYWREHQIATAIEKQMAHWLGIDWAEYDKAVSEL